MTNIKKCLALVLVVILVATMFPANGMAADPTPVSFAVKIDGQLVDDRYIDEMVFIFDHQTKKDSSQVSLGEEPVRVGITITDNSGGTPVLYCILQDYGQIIAAGENTINVSSSNLVNVNINVTATPEGVVGTPEELGFVDNNGYYYGRKVNGATSVKVSEGGYGDIMAQISNGTYVYVFQNGVVSRYKNEKQSATYPLTSDFTFSVDLNLQSSFANTIDVSQPVKSVSMVSITDSQPDGNRLVQINNTNGEIQANTLTITDISEQGTKEIYSKQLIYLTRDLLALSELFQAASATFTTKLTLVDGEVISGQVNYVNGAASNSDQIIIKPDVDGTPLEVKTVSAVYKDSNGEWNQWLPINNASPGNTRVCIQGVYNNKPCVLYKDVTLQTGENIISFSTSEIAEVTINLDNNNLTGVKLGFLTPRTIDNFWTSVKFGESNNTVYLTAGDYSHMETGIEHNGIIYGFIDKVFSNTGKGQNVQHYSLTGSVALSYSMKINVTVPNNQIYVDSINGNRLQDFAYLEDINQNPLRGIEIPYENTYMPLPITIRLYQYNDVSQSEAQVLSQTVNRQEDIINFGSISGQFRMEYILGNNPDTPIMKIDVPDVQLIQNTTVNDQQNALEAFNFNVENGTQGYDLPYFSFTTKSENDYTNVNSVNISINGAVVSNAIYSSDNGRIYNFNLNGFVKLYDVLDNTPIFCDQIYGQIVDISISSGGFRESLFSMGLRNSDKSSLGLEAGKTYRIEFTSDLPNLMLSQLHQYTFTSGDMNAEAYINLRNDGSDTNFGWSRADIENTSNSSTIPSIVSLRKAVLDQDTQSELVKDVVFNGPSCKFYLGDTMGLSSLNKIDIIAETSDDLPLPSNLVVEVDGKLANLSTSKVEKNGYKAYQFSISILNESQAQDMRSTDSVITLSGADIESFKGLVANAINNRSSDITRGYAYIIARNSSGIINAYKACTKIESEIYINPTFEFGENETTPIIGRIEHLGEYTTSTINHELWLKNIGLNNVTRVLVDGVTKYEENGVIVEKPFLLTFGLNGLQGNYMCNFYLNDMLSDTLITYPVELMSKDVQARQSYMVADFDAIEHYMQIPVKKSVKNTVELTYYYGNGEEKTITFDYYPKDKEDVFSHVSFKNYTIRPDANVIQVELIDFDGNPDNMKLNLSIIEDNIKVQKAQFNSVISSSNYTYHGQFTDGTPYTSEKTLITFELGDGGWSQLDTLENNQILYGELTYEDAITSDYTFLVQAGVSGNMKIDTLPPEVYVGFNQLVEKDGQQWYQFNVNFNDQVDLSKVTKEKFTVIDNNGQEITDFMYEGGRHEGDTSPDTAPYSFMYLYLKQRDRGYKLIIDSLQDIAGNVKTNIEKKLNIGTNIKGTLKKGSNALPNKYMHLLSLDELSDIATSMVSYNQIYYYCIPVDENGGFNLYIYPGRYKVVSFSDDKTGSNQISTQEIIDIPLLSNGEFLQSDIIIPEDNLKGNLKREPQYSLVEGLILLNDSLSSAFYEARLMKEDAADWATRSQYSTKYEILLKHFTHKVSTDDAGNFGTYLKPGKYRVIGKYNNGDYSNYEPYSGDVTQGVISVPEDGSVVTLSDIVFSQPNAIITVLDSNNSPVKDAFVHISKANEGFGIYGCTDNMGKVAIHLPEAGSYVLDGAEIQASDSEGLRYIGMSSSETGFSYSGDMLETTITLPQTNTEVVFKVDGLSVSGNANYGILLTDAKGKIYNANTANGKIKLYVKDGTYTIKNYRVGNNTIQDYNTSFTVASGSVASQIIDISNMINAQIKLQDSAGNPVVGARIELHNTDNNSHFSLITNSGGYAYCSIDAQTQDVELQIKGYTLNGVWNELQNTVLIVQASNAGNNRAEKLITVNLPNFKGRVEDKNGIVFKNGWIEIEKLGANIRFGKSINSDGTFSFDINETGSYIVHYARKDDTKLSIGYAFKVVFNETTQTYVVRTMDGQEVITPIILTELAPNFTGTLVNREGVPYKTDGSYVGLQLREKTTSELYKQYPWLFELWVEVDSEGVDAGKFEYNLDETKQYEVIGVTTVGNYYPFESPVDVVISRTQANNIRPKVANFSGCVRDYDGNLVKNGWIYLEQVVNSNTNGVGVSANGGYFDKNLDNGETYTIRSVGYQQIDYSWQYMNLNRKVTIGDNTSNLTLEPNIKGSIQLGELLNQEYNNISIRIAQILQRSDFSSDAEYMYYLNNRWRYENWMVGIKNQDKLEFVGYLEEGNYQITRVDLDSRSLEFKEDFIISAQDSINGKYALNFNLVPNLSGVIKESNTPIAGAWVSVNKLNEDWTNINDTTSDNYFGTSTDKDGSFKFKLAKGKYKLQGYHTKGYWEGTIWHEGAWVESSFMFSVDETGTIFNKNGNTIAEINLSPNISGTIMKLHNGAYSQLLGGGMMIYDRNQNGQPDWESYRWVRTGRDNNAFKAYLPDGNYVILDAGDNTSWFRANVSFDVVNGSITNISPEYLQNGMLVIKQGVPNFTGTLYKNYSSKTPLGWAWMAIKPAADADNNWENVIHIETDKNGVFAARIPDGEWVLAEFGNQNFFTRPHTIFTVVNGSVDASQLPNGMTAVSGKLDVYSPTANFSIIVKKSDGTNLNQSGWIAIKPASASEYNWTDVIWVENKLGENGIWKAETRLAVGEYKVVEVNYNGGGYKVDIPFTITATNSFEATVAKQQPNFIGKAYSDATGVTQITWGRISLARLDQNGKQLTMDGKELPQDAKIDQKHGISWEHTMGTSIENGSFSFKLGNGIYKVVYVSSDGTAYVPAQAVYTITETGLLDNTGSKLQEISVRKPGENVTVEFLNVPASLNDEKAVITVYKLVNGEKAFVNLTFEQKTSDSSYQFKGSLENGTYVVAVFTTAKGSLDIDANDGKITVTETGSLTIDLLNEACAINGTVKLLDEPNAPKSVTQRIWLSFENVNTKEIKKIQTSETGTFTLMLPTNTTWKIVARTTYEGGYMPVIKGTEIVVPNDASATLVLNID